MKSVTQVQTLDEAVYASFCINALGKGMNSPVLPPAIGN